MVVGILEFGPQDRARLGVETASVEPVHVVEGGVLPVLETVPGARFCGSVRSCRDR